ncbi:MAG: prolyl oligopeptidase family serine peptidase, partial [Myxococcales bacterium]|nr:prolyl oligopeptidase family serine peptidase [Myxococcales bacterium]
DSVKDIGALLDWIKAQKELDAKRVALHGGSYGGYMVLASLEDYADRLVGGVDIVGVSDFKTFLANTKDYRRDLRRVEYGDERDPKIAAFFDAISPLKHADRIQDPLFVVQGANDPRVPASEAEQIVAAVRASGQEAWYMLALDEGHGFRKKANSDAMAEAVVLFLESIYGGTP